MSIQDEIKAAQEAAKTAERPKSDPIDILVGDKVRQVIIYRADPSDWSVAVGQNPPRDGIRLDLLYGYSAEGVAMTLMPEYGRILDGADEQKLIKEDWDALRMLQAGPVRRNFDIAVWALNDRGPRDEVEAAKKASRRARKKKRS